MIVAALIQGTTVSTVIAIITGASACSFVVAARIYKSLADGYKSERNLAIEKADRLSDEVKELRTQCEKLEAQIQTLRLKDVSALFDLMKHHDERAQQASQEILAALQRITLPHT
jgi:phage shock protein A